MYRNGLFKFLVVSACGLALGLVPLGAASQAVTPADLAAKLSGVWKMNRELSPGFAAGRGRGGPGRGASRPSYAVGFQRGGGGGVGGGQTGTADLTPEELAGQAAMRDLQQVADTITITATADSVTFKDTRGERTYAVNDKSTKIQAGIASISAKSKWDKTMLKQEFSNAQTKVTYTWEPDAAGKQLTMKLKVEGLNQSAKEVKAIFEK